MQGLDQAHGDGMNICDIGPTWCALWSLCCMLFGGLVGVFGLAIAIAAKDKRDE